MGRTPKRIKRRNRGASQGHAAKVEPRARQPTPSDDCSFEYECLSLFYEILSKAGLPRARLRQVSKAALAPIKKSRKSWDAGALAYFQRLPHILSLWHLLTEYVDSEYVHSAARPRKLKLSAPRPQPSLFGLIRRVFPNENPANVFETLRRVGAVRPSGQFWLPTGRTLVFKSAEVARLGILNEIRNFLRTANWNLTRRQKLLQRSVFNPAVPVRQLQTLNAREKADADQFLILRDADLTAEQQRTRTGEPVSGIGIGTYAYRDTSPITAMNATRPGSKRMKTKKRVR